MKRCASKSLRGGSLVSDDNFDLGDTSMKFVATRDQVTIYNEDGAIVSSYQPDAGARVLVPCLGGPSTSRLATYPPPLEIDVDGGTYVLVDDGPFYDWRYEFVPR